MQQLVYFTGVGVLPGFVVQLDLLDGGSILAELFPITPREIHPGYLIGSDRILTVRSGLFSLGNESELETIIYQADGYERTRHTNTTTVDGVTFSQVDLNPGEIAIIKERV